MKRSVRFPVPATLVRLLDRRPVPATLLRRLAYASIVANIGLVVTGAAVRLTGVRPGLPHLAPVHRRVVRHHGGDGRARRYRVRQPAARRRARPDRAGPLLAGCRSNGAGAGALAALALGALGIPAQAVLGGLTVLTDLNPWVVGLHFLLSMAIIAAAYALWRRTARGTAPAGADVPAPLREPRQVTAVVSARSLVVGTW